MKQFEKLLGLEETSTTEIVVQKKTPVPTEIKPPNEPEEKNEALEQIKSDFDMARETMLKVLRATNEAADKALLIANEKEDARSFEALNGTLTNLASASLNLMELHRRKVALIPTAGVGDGKDVSSKKIPEGSAINIDKAVFVGNNKDLNLLIEKMNQKKEET